jgi:hypothetical protein
MSGQPAKSLWGSFLDDRGRNFIEQLEYWIEQLDEFEKNPTAARVAAPQNFCINCLRLAKRLLFLKSKMFSKPEEPCKHALQSLEDDSSSDRHLQDFCNLDGKNPDVVLTLGKGLILDHREVCCPALNQSRKARTYRLAAALCSIVQMLHPTDPKVVDEAAYFGALAEFRLGVVSSARKRVGSKGASDDESMRLWNNLNSFLKLQLEEEKKKIVVLPAEITLALSVSTLHGFTPENYPGTFNDIVHPADGQSLFDRSGDADHACAWNPSILKKRFPALEKVKSDDKKNKILRYCVQLMDMPSEFATRQFLRKELDLQWNCRVIACIGSWNVMCSSNLHNPNKTFELKMKSVLKLVLSQNWGIVALQELPGETVKLPDDTGGFWKAHMIEEQIMTIIRGEKGLQSSTAQESSDWQWKGLTVGKQKHGEHGGFLFNSRLWKIEEEIKQFGQKELFTRPPILAVFTSVEAPRIVLAIASVHLKARDDQGLERTQTEAAQLGRVADELKSMAEAERFRQEATSRIYAIVGDFNLSPISGDQVTTPTIRSTGESAFKSLEDKGFDHLVKGQTTNAKEFMITASEGHCYDNCFVKIESPAFEILPSYVLAPYPNHLPSVEDWNTAIDNAVHAVPEGKFQELMKGLVRKTLEKKRKKYMVNTNTSDHRAITIRFKQEVGPSESSAAACAATPVSTHAAPLVTPATLRPAEKMEQKLNVDKSEDESKAVVTVVDPKPVAAAAASISTVHPSAAAAPVVEGPVIHAAAAPALQAADHQPPSPPPTVPLPAAAVVVDPKPVAVAAAAISVAAHATAHPPAASLPQEMPQNPKTGTSYEAALAQASPPSAIPWNLFDYAQQQLSKFELPTLIELCTNREIKPGETVDACVDLLLQWKKRNPQPVAAAAESIATAQPQAAAPNVADARAAADAEAAEASLSQAPTPEKKLKTKPVIGGGAAGH